MARLRHRRGLVNGYEIVVSFVPGHRGRGKGGRGFKKIFRRKLRYTMIHSLRAVIVTKRSDGTYRVKTVKCYTIKQNRLTPPIPRHLSYDLRRFWANLLEGGSDDEFLEDQYLKHGINCKVSGRVHYFTRGLELGRRIVEPGKSWDLLRTLRTLGGGIIPGRDYDTPDLMRVLETAYGCSAYVDVKTGSGDVGYLNGVSVLYDLNFEKWDVRRRQKRIPVKFMLEDFQ